MKNMIKNLSATILVVFITLSFTSLEKKQIKTNTSKVVWKGYKVTGSHHGTISIKSGSLTFTNEKLTSGEFTIDMTTISNADLTGKYKDKLEKHLKSDDFFEVSNFPTATLTFDKVNETKKNTYHITGDLTIKDITNPIEFNIVIDGNKATTSLKIDRTKFNVKYRSTSFFENLKDKAIYDEFDLEANLEF